MHFYVHTQKEGQDEMKGMKDIGTKNTSSRLRKEGRPRRSTPIIHDTKRPTDLPVESLLVVAGAIGVPRESLVDTFHPPFWVGFCFVWSVP